MEVLRVTWKMNVKVAFRGTALCTNGSGETLEIMPGSQNLSLYIPRAINLRISGFKENVVDSPSRWIASDRWCGCSTFRRKRIERTDRRRWKWKIQN